MWEIIYLAVLMGFLGSFHCAGMCGSLMIFHFSSLTKNSFVLNFLVYHFARISGYALLGMFFGQIGFLGYLLGIQQFVSLFLGLLMIFIALKYFFPISMQFLPSINVTSFLNGIYSSFQSLTTRYLLAGFANSILPCGFSFMAMLFSVTTYSMLKGVVFMFFFGLAHIPALLLVALFSQKLQFTFRISKYVMPSIALLTGILLILRSMNLGIQWISPDIKISEKNVKIECHK
ncbi:MAG: hypothetical protein KatS3mg027_0218 [Bacteroidia bacterium]|nr:MAG: hypothetical protein KatS3mg027_0218 [Bacteroidia bacterium]